MLQVRDLHAGYGKSEVLRGISFDVQRGEIVTIVGANGAGKTTTLRTLCGIVRATGGSIDFDGVPLATRQPHEIVELGVTMIPEMAIASGILEHTRIAARPLQSDRAWRDIALVWRRNSPREKEFHLLAEILRDAAAVSCRLPEAA